MEKAIQLEIFGRVQGVNFRENLKREAEHRNLKGVIMNTKEGTVVAKIEGQEDMLHEILSWAQRGQFPAKVTGMNFQWFDELEGFKDVEIKREGNYFLDRAKGVFNLGKKLLSPQETINVPKHIVIIPDGNRRWARSKGWKAFVGHKKGISYERVKSLFDLANQMGVEYLSLWGFSTENWDRSEEEINYLWNLFRENIVKWKSEFIRDGIRFTHLGRKDRLPEDVIKLMDELEKETSDLKNFNFQLCLDYGGRDDIVRAVNKMIASGVTKIDENSLKQYLDTGANIPDPDLIIRTSGEQRTSGIMAYQGVYSELYFTNKHFPDFEADDLRLAILDYSGRTRRFGGTAANDLASIDESKLVDPDLLGK